jgi:hypothetical protein
VNGTWTTNSSQLAIGGPGKKHGSGEYSPENTFEHTNHNSSHSTACTADTALNNNVGGTFQITVSKKPQAIQNLTKEVKPEKTTLGQYNFNDYGATN